jgi:hypothetical protein
MGPLEMPSYIVLFGGIEKKIKPAWANRMRRATGATLDPNGQRPNNRFSVCDPTKNGPKRTYLMFEMGRAVGDALMLKSAH